VTTLEHLPYSPELAAVDFLPAPSNEIIIEGRVFCDNTDIIENVTEELKRISQYVSNTFTVAGRIV
jgi:hypothetical protein